MSPQRNQRTQWKKREVQKRYQLAIKIGKEIVDQVGIVRTWDPFLKSIIGLPSEIEHYT